MFAGNSGLLISLCVIVDVKMKGRDGNKSGLTALKYITNFIGTKNGKSSKRSERQSDVHIASGAPQQESHPTHHYEGRNAIFL
jgi:hypothetical protein